MYVKHFTKEICTNYHYYCCSGGGRVPEGGGAGGSGGGGPQYQELHGDQARPRPGEQGPAGPLQEYLQDPGGWLVSVGVLD